MAETQGILLGVQVRGGHRAAECQGVRQAEQDQGVHPAGIQANTAVETARLAKLILVEAMVVPDLTMAKQLPTTVATTDTRAGITAKAMTRESSAQARPGQAAPVTMIIPLPEVLKTATRMAMSQVKMYEVLTHLSTSTTQDMR